MKKTLASISIAAIMAFAFTSCNTPSTEPAHDPAQPSKTVMTKVGPEFTSKYICPMHCEGSGSDKPGKCPVCEMDYKENPDLKPQAADSAAH